MSTMLFPGNLDSYLTKLYSYNGGYVKLMSGKNRRGLFVPTADISDPVRFRQIIDEHFTSPYNIYMSMASYLTKKNARADNILDVRCLCVDMDYTRLPQQKNISVERAIRLVQLMVQENIIPLPTAIEYSRNIRLVYIFDEPFRLKKKAKIRQQCMTLLRRIMQVLCKKANDWMPFLDTTDEQISFHFCAEPQLLTSFVRVPGSFNQRTSGYYDAELQEYLITSREIYPVQLNLIGDTWDFQRFADSVLPPLFEGYDEWRAKKAKRRKKKKNLQSVQKMARRRLQMLEMLQKYFGYDIGFRENMCYLFWVHCQKAGDSYEKASAKTLVFNQGFRHPLLERFVLTECKPAPFRGSSGQTLQGFERKFSDRTIREMLQIDDCWTEIFHGESSIQRSRKYRDKKRMEMKKAGKTKKQRMQKAIEKAIRLRKAGATLNTIAKSLAVSRSTIKRYLKKGAAKTEKKHMPRASLSPAPKKVTQTRSSKKQTIPHKEIIRKKHNIVKRRE